LCNILIPQLLWSARVRSTPLLLFVISIVVNIGMWIERFVIIVVSLHRDFLPSSWDMYAGTVWDWATFLGTIGLFLTLIFLFIRVLPMVSISEMSHLLSETKQHEVVDQSTAPVPPFNSVSAESVSAPMYGLLAEFEAPEELLAKAKLAYQAGYRRLSAYSPFPVEGLSDAIGHRPTRLPLLVLLGGIGGALGGFFMQYYAAVIDYPWNIGGRPFNSWPSFIVVTFELTILAAAGVAVLGMFLRNGLPMHYHPVFNAPRFKLASQDRFFLCIKANDPMFDPLETRQFLASLAPAEVVAIENRQTRLWPFSKAVK
jgi:hypothetical protein